MASSRSSGGYVTETFTGASPVSGVAPTAVDGTDGQPTDNLDAITVVLSAPSGQTLSGAGALHCYILFPSVNRWARFPAGDFGAPTASVRDHAYETVDLVGRVKGAYIKWIPSGITYSGASASVVITQQGSFQSAGNRKAAQG